MGLLKARIKIGNVVFSIWDNEAVIDGKITIIPNITINKLYLKGKNKEGKNIWGYTTNFDEKDMPNIKEVIERHEREEYDKR